MAVELEELLVPDAAAWRAWLEANHADSPGVWLVLHKKGGTVTELDYDAALDEALCFGWIDGQVRKRDDGSYFQRMTRRGPKSPWSERNVGHVARLEEAGKMTAAGRAAVDSAKADGRWEAAYSGQATAEVPADLAAAIAAVPRRAGHVRRPHLREPLCPDLPDQLGQAGLHPGAEDRRFRGDAGPRRDPVPAGQTAPGVLNAEP